MAAIKAEAVSKVKFNSVKNFVNFECTLCFFVVQITTLTTKSHKEYHKVTQRTFETAPLNIVYIKL
jgi:hypothetical protein